MSSKRDRIARLAYWRDKNTKHNAITRATKERPNGRAGYIYIAHLGEDLYKIGKTTNPQRRNQELSASNILCKIVYSIYVTDCYIAEKAIHKELRKLKKTREIFSLNQDDLAKAKEDLCRIQEILQHVP